MIQEYSHSKLCYRPSLQAIGRMEIYMRISILTGRFGMGHLITAEAMKEHIYKSGLDAEVEIIDWFEYISPRMAERYYGFFELMVKKGFKIYNTRYRIMENMKTDQKPELYRYFSRCFERYLEEKKSDLIISTLPLCSQIVSFYKEKTGSSIPLITCVTDITGHSEWINKNTDIYLVGSYTVREKFIKKGVLPSKIFVTGIPVRPEFIMSSQRMDNDVNKKILIMGGGFGMLPIEHDFYQDLDNLPNVEFTVITGRNHSLYHSLRGKYRNIQVLGYVTNVFDYMAEVDAIITKPGGVTTFEAISAELPILALNPLLQQEKYNAQFIQEMKIGTVINLEHRLTAATINEFLQQDQLDFYKYHIQKIKNSLDINLLYDILFEVCTMNCNNEDRDFA